MEAASVLINIQPLDGCWIDETTSTDKLSTQSHMRDCGVWKQTDQDNDFYMSCCETVSICISVLFLSALRHVDSHSTERYLTIQAWQVTVTQLDQTVLPQTMTVCWSPVWAAYYCPFMFIINHGRLFGCMAEPDKGLSTEKLLRCVKSNLIHSYFAECLTDVIYLWHVD